MTTIDRDELVAYLDELLDEPRQADYGPNGLQVEGRREVRKVVTAVSACREVFTRAAAAGADLVLVHHGLFWTGMPARLTGVQYGRVAALIENGLSLAAYHLPLDRHGELGNNVLGARAFGLTEIAPFCPYEGEPIGFRGRFPEPIRAAELVSRCERVYGRAPLAFLEGPDPVSSLGIVSGGAQKELWTAIADGLDAYLTGEASEWVMNVAREAGIHYLAAGHYATEVLGVRTLGEHVAERFGIGVEFVDVPNPV
jgi:dinuclear metal center YbgI/SA1388 family protein